MRSKVALLHELRNDGLLQRRGLAVDQIARADESLPQGPRHHGVADKQRLVERADVDHLLGIIEALQRCQRRTRIAELAGVIILDDEGPLCLAHANSSRRRTIDIATPVGNWCEGVTKTARARGAVRRPASTIRPWTSTEIACGRTLASNSWAWVRG